MERPWIESVNFRKRPKLDEWYIHVNGVYVGVYRLTFRLIEDVVLPRRTYDLLWDYEAIETLFDWETTVYPNRPGSMFLPRLYALYQQPDAWLVLWCLISNNFAKNQGFV